MLSTLDHCRDRSWHERMGPLDSNKDTFLLGRPKSVRRSLFLAPTGPSRLEQELHLAAGTRLKRGREQFNSVIEM